MSPSPYDEIDRAVLLARKAVSSGRATRPPAHLEPLTRFLHQHWFLGSALRDRADRGPEPWRSWGPAWTEQGRPRGADLVRLYLSCAPHTTLHAVAAVTARAAGWDAPWLLSTRALGRPVPRPDATVLYLPAAGLARLHPELLDLLDDLTPFLAGTVPALTLRVARGASLAQNPADGRRYGEHRCSVVARTVLAHRDAHHREVVERTLAAFRGEDVDPDRPYRALGASWDAAWEAPRAGSRPRHRPRVAA